MKALELYSLKPWHVDCHGGGTVCPRTSDAVPAEDIKIL